MFDKCITCSRIGESCVPNLMRLPFPDLIQWCNKRQKHIGWTNQVLADNSKVPVGTINRIKAGDYLDCKYSTIRNIVITLIGGTDDEYHCNEQIENELKQLDLLDKKTEQVTVLEKENKCLKNRLNKIDELHRKDIRVIKEEYQEQIVFMKEQLKAWQTWHQNKPD